MRIERLRRELVDLRKELEFIEGQIHNDQILGGLENDGLGELSARDADKLLAQNEKLITEVIVLETLLEDAGPDTARGG